MKAKECPGCAMEVGAENKVCPICGYEFPETGRGIKIVAIILVVLLLLLWVIF